MKAHRIICFGDSITQAWAASIIDGWPGALQFALEAEFPGRYKVYNRGAGGNTTAQAMERIEPDVKPHLPGTVLVEFGINDSNVRLGRKYFRVGPQEFAANLTEINRYVKQEGGDCIFIANHNGFATENRRQGNGKTHMANTAPHQRAIFETGRKLKVPVIDFPRRLRKLGYKDESIVTPDGIHLSDEGNRIYGRVIFEALKEIFRV